MPPGRTVDFITLVATIGPLQAGQYFPVKVVLLSPKLDRAVLLNFFSAKSPFLLNHQTSICKTTFEYIANTSLWSTSLSREAGSGRDRALRGHATNGHLQEGPTHPSDGGSCNRPK
jgi:hypothetical protein